MDGPHASSPANLANETKATKTSRRAKRAAKSSRKARIFFTMGPKGGVGKSFTARALIDLLTTIGGTPRIVQVDRGRLLPDLYPGATVVHVPSAEEMRTNPLAAISSFKQLEVALDACLDDGADLVVDVGAAQNARVFVEFLAKARIDAYLADYGIRPVALLLMTAEPSAMSQSADLAEILATVHPSAEIVIALNERDGDFCFRAGTHVHHVWAEQVQPLVANRRCLTIPAMAAGAWPFFEGQGLTFREIVEADECMLARQLGESRAVAVTLQGDVSEWIEKVWSQLAPVIADATGGGNAR